MTGIRHFTASAIVLDNADRVLLVHHNKLQQWLYPGGHIDPNEDPAEAALREVREETGVTAEIVHEPRFTHPAVRAIPAPCVIMEMDVRDTKIGRHRHIDLVYVCRAVSVDLSHQPDEVSGARWVPMAEVATLDTPAELPALIAAAIKYARSGG